MRIQVLIEKGSRDGELKVSVHSGSKKIRLKKKDEVHTFEIYPEVQASEWIRMDGGDGSFGGTITMG